MIPRRLSFLIIISLLSTLLFWLVFYFKLPQYIGFPKSDLHTLYANYDGPNYLIIAKCGYNPDCISTNYSLPSPASYYPAHLPGYPSLIRLLDLIFPGPQAMLLVTLTGSIFLTVMFWYLLNLYFSPRRSFWLSLVFLFFPARLFILRQIGAPETWFLAAIISSVYFFKKNRIFLSAVFAAAAQTFKSPGIILFAAYATIALHQFLSSRSFRTVAKTYLPYLLVPLTVLVMFVGYHLQTGDFWAYFRSGDNFHLYPLPYPVFISSRSWINTIWLEDVIYIFLFAFNGVYLLWKKLKFNLITVFVFLFVFATSLVAHRDISRYIAPCYPFLIIAYHRFINKPGFRFCFLLLLPAIFLYAVNFVLGNTAPVADWGPYL